MAYKIGDKLFHELPLLLGVIVETHFDWAGIVGEDDLEWSDVCRRTGREESPKYVEVVRQYFIQGRRIFLR